MIFFLLRVCFTSSLHVKLYFYFTLSNHFCSHSFLICFFLCIYNKFVLISYKKEMCDRFYFLITLTTIVFSLAFTTFTNIVLVKIKFYGRLTWLMCISYNYGFYCLNLYCILNFFKLFFFFCV